GGAGELLALRAHRLWRACLPFTFFQEAVESSAGQWLAILVDCFAGARFLRHCRADRQGSDDGSEDNSLHGTSSRWSTRRLQQKLPLPTAAIHRPTAPTPPLQAQLLPRLGTAGNRRRVRDSQISTPVHAKTAICRRLPIRRPLFDERPHSFLSVGGRGDVAEILHRLANAAPVIEIVDTHESSASQPHGCSRLRRKNTRHCPCFVPHPLVRDDPADEAEGKGFFGAKGATAEQQLEGAMTADDARQMHKMNCRNEAEIDFGITKCRAFPGKEHVAGNGQRHAATPRRTADGSDRRLAETVLYVGQFHVELVQ